MKKVLLASSVLALSAGIASAEVSFTGTAVMGVGDNGDSLDNGVRSVMETYLTATGSGETDTGLSFGLETIFATYTTDDESFTDDGTQVFISGAFGRLSMGDVTEADEMPGSFSDIGGLAGLGVDDIAESYTGDEAGGAFGDRESHDVNYTYSGGALTFAISAQIGAQGDDDGEGDGYALGLRYAFGDAYVGIGYNDDGADAYTDLSGAVTTLYAGGTFGAFGVRALYSDYNADSDSIAEDGDAFGLHVSYTVDALTLAAQYAESDIIGAGGNSYEAFGVGAAYDLGGGASVVGGVAQITDADRDDETVWETGLSFEF